MRHLLHLLPLLLLIVSCKEEDTPEPIAIQPNKPDYFVGWWGDSKETIIQQEGNNHFENTATRLGYYSFWPDRTNTYIFENNRLVGAETVIEKVAENNYLAEYVAEVHSLLEREGRKQSEQLFWASDAIKSQYSPNLLSRLYITRTQYSIEVASELNTAIKAGHLRMVSTWVNNRTEAQLTLGNENQNGSPVEFRKVYKSLSAR